MIRNEMDKVCEAWLDEYEDGDSFCLWAVLPDAFAAGAEHGANDALTKLKKKLEEAALCKHQHALEHQGPGAYGHVRGLRHAEELVKAMLEEKA